MKPSNIFALALVLLVLAVIGYVLYEGLWLLAEFIAQAINDFEYN